MVTKMLPEDPRVDDALSPSAAVQPRENAGAQADGDQSRLHRSARRGLASAREPTVDTENTDGIPMAWRHAVVSDHFRSRGAPVESTPDQRVLTREAVADGTEPPTRPMRQLRGKRITKASSPGGAAHDRRWRERVREPPRLDADPSQTPPPGLCRSTGAPPMEARPRSPSNFARARTYVESLGQDTSATPFPAWSWPQSGLGRRALDGSPCLGTGDGSTRSMGFLRGARALAGGVAGEGSRVLRVVQMRDLAWPSGLLENLQSVNVRAVLSRRNPMLEGPGPTAPATDERSSTLRCPWRSTP